MLLKSFFSYWKERCPCVQHDNTPFVCLRLTLFLHSGGIRLNWIVISVLPKTKQDERLMWNPLNGIDEVRERKMWTPFGVRHKGLILTIKSISLKWFSKEVCVKRTLILCHSDKNIQHKWQSPTLSWEFKGTRMQFWIGRNTNEDTDYLALPRITGNYLSVYFFNSSWTNLIELTTTALGVFGWWGGFLNIGENLAF